MVASKEDFSDDTWVYLENVKVADTSNRQSEVEEFIQGKSHRLEFKKNAIEKKYEKLIKVFGFTKKIIGENKYFLGYIPKEVTKTIITGDFFDYVNPSPPSFRQDGRIFFDLQGSIKKEKNFKFLFEQVLLEEGFLK